MCFSRRVRLLLIVIAAGVSVSAETHKPIYRIRRYCKATSEYSPIRSIGLTLLATLKGLHLSKLWVQVQGYSGEKAIAFNSETTGWKFLILDRNMCYSDASDLQLLTFDLDA